MKSALLALLLSLISQGASAQVFTIDAEGIVKCSTANVGDKGTILGVIYEAVDNNLLRQRRDQGADLTKVCTSLVTNLSQMFAGIEFNQSIGNWDVSNVTNMSRMFFESSFNQPIGNWDVSKVTSMAGMFDGNQIFNQDIGNWDVSNVVTMEAMFKLTIFNHNINKWNVGNLKNMSVMFEQSMFNQPLGNWDVSNVTNMNALFDKSSFNQPIGNWNVRNVINMTRMFLLSNFNQNINQWCVIKINFQPEFFSAFSPMSPGNLPIWGTCPGLPLAAVLTTPLNNASNLTTRPTFEWTQEPNSTSYQLQVIESGNIVLDVLIQSAKLTLLTSLNTGSEYFWRVRGINDQRKLTGDWSPTWRFNTLFIPGPSLLTPANNATGLSGNVQLNWSPTTNTPDYQLQVSTSNTFETLRLNTTVSAPPFALAAFQPGDPTSFFWRVRSNSAFGPGAWSPTWTFTRAKLTSTGNEAEVPAEYSLSQNFPNPFNPTTQISFTLPRSASVRLEVFNSLGQPVSVLAEGMLPAGAHTYAFDGAALSSGVYLYRLTTPDFVQTRVMALVK